ncbi:hypothetical protein [Sphingobium sp. DC-2]|uniref:hypothetical protein n=1 Tax=Sphingobium sp. DC-2 TaxID=1303256 RepID=UPI0004C3A600|nr:hypothetical protein [Sphingobium sp. DC-2]
MRAGRAALLAVGLLSLTAARPPMRYQPDPSSVFAAELAFNRLAREKGQWTAFRETAAEDAIMFVPQRVLAKQWLKGRADPPRPAAWTPSTIYVSCDGTLAASTGNWTQPDGTAGYFTTLWRRDKKGQWKWIAAHEDRLAAPRMTSDFLMGKVASCKPRQRGAQGVPPPADDSLTWSADAAADGSRRVTVRMWNGSGYDMVIDDRVAAPGQ